MKKMHLQELMNLIAVMELSVTLLKMLYPVETCILNLWRKALLHSNVFNISDDHTGSALIADILHESFGHQTYTSISHCPMCSLLVHPEFWITTPSFVKEEVAE
jgi:hypothetical protein